MCCGTYQGRLARSRTGGRLRCRATFTFTAITTTATDTDITTSRCTSRLVQRRPG